MGRSKGFVLCMILVIMLSTNNLLISVISSTTTSSTPTCGTNFENQKNFYSLDPHLPSGHQKSSHGQINCVTPPTPSSRGGSGSGYYPSPSTTPPSRGDGGGHHRPPKHTPINPPRGGGGYYPPTPTTPTPVIITPPSSPLAPSPPIIPIVPSPCAPRTPLTPYDPTSPPFPCTFWGSHPQLIFGVLGWWATVGGLWGVTTLPGLSSATSLQQVLTNPRNDGYGSLYREGTAAFLNSMAAARVFPFSTKQVKDAFLASLDSERAAASQARFFKLANERKFKPTTSKP